MELNDWESWQMISKIFAIVVIGLLIFAYGLVFINNSNLNETKTVEGKIQKINYNPSTFSESSSYDVKINGSVYVLHSIEEDGKRLKENNTYKITIEKNLDERYDLKNIEKMDEK